MSIRQQQHETHYTAVKGKQIMSTVNLKSTKISVSSVLNKDVKQYGKNFMFDSKEDTCWNSDQGSPQWIAIKFDTPRKITSFRFQFQGGFAGKECSVKIDNPEGTCQEPFYPEDVNSIQNFNLGNAVENAIKIVFTFNSSTDFFGRIIVYNLEIL